MKRGDLVEVFSRDEVYSVGLWDCAEIVSESKHTYIVKYSAYPFVKDQPMETVLKKFVRPYPPNIVDDLHTNPHVWIVGDTAEVYHNHSWKRAKILKTINHGISNKYVAMVLDSPLDVMVYQSEVRTPLTWKDGKWFLLGKGIEIPTKISEIGMKVKARQVSTRCLKRKSLIASSSTMESSDNESASDNSIESIKTKKQVKLNMFGLKSPIPPTENTTKIMSVCASSSSSNGIPGSLMAVEDNMLVGLVSKNVEDNKEDYCSDAESSNEI